MTHHVECIKKIVKNRNKLALINYLNCVHESKNFSSNSTQTTSLISFANELLDEKRNRTFGLIIIDKILSQTPKNVISVHLSTWFEQCIKGIAQKDDDTVSSLSIALIRQLLLVTLEFPDLKKQTSLNILPKITECFFKRAPLREGNRIEKLKCLEILLKKYPKSCVKYKDEIHSFIFEHLESVDSEVHYAGLCLLYFILTGPGNADGSKYTETWQKHVHFILSALHNRLDKLFSNINEIQGSQNDYLSEDQLTDVPKIKETNLVVKMQRLSTHFRSLAEFLFILCRAEVSFPTPIKVEDILSVVCRGLAINGKTLNSNISADSLNLLPQIPSIHQSCIRIAEGLILSLKFDIYRYSLIPKALVQTLQWTQTKEWPYGHEKPYSSLRISAYKCLNLWMMTTHSTAVKTEIPQFLEDIISNIVNDIYQKRETVTLNIDVGKSKKKNKKVKTNANTKIKTPFVENPSANSQICKVALETIQPLLEASKYDIKQEHFTKLVEVVIELLSTMSCTAKGIKIQPIPYSVDECRLELYRCLLTLTLYNKPQFPSPICYASKLFEEGYHDSSPEVSNLCAMAIACTNNILYPNVPLEGFVRQTDKIQNVLEIFADKKKKEKRSFIDISVQESSIFENSNFENTNNNFEETINEKGDEIEILNVNISEKRTRTDDDEVVLNKKHKKEKIKEPLSTSSPSIKPTINIELVNISDDSDTDVVIIEKEDLEKNVGINESSQLENNSTDVIIEKDVPKNGNNESSLIEEDSKIDDIEGEMLNSFVDIV